MVLSPSDLWFRRKHNYHSMIEWFITNVKHTQVACVAGGFCGVYFFCGSQSKSYSRPKVEPRSKQNTIGRGRGEKALLNLLLLTTKEKSTPKNPPATQANTQQRANTIHFKLCFFSRNTCLCFHVQSSALVASFLSLPGKQPGEATSLRSKRFQSSYCAKVRAKATESPSWHERGKFFFTATFRGQIFCHSFEIRQDWKFSEVSWRYKESFGWNRRQHSSGQRWKKCLSENRAWEGKTLSTAYD